MARRHRKRRTLSPWWIIISMIGAIAAAVLLIYFTREAPTSAGQTGSAAAASAPKLAAPDFTLAGPDGDVTLASFRGQYVLLNFWASWCPPCMREMPDLQAYHREFQDDGFTLLAVNVAEDLSTVRAFLNANDFDFPVALDASGAVYNRYGGGGLPSSFLIGPDGSLVKVWRPGAITRAMLDEDVTPLLRG